MTHPTFTSDGYPTEETLQAIREWPANVLHDLFAFIGEAWQYQDYWHRGLASGLATGEYHFSTGGWSGNEDLIGALQGNAAVWALCWYSSRRGGHYTFLLPVKRAEEAAR